MTWILGLMETIITLIVLSLMTAVTIWVALKIVAALLGFYSICDAFRYFGKWLKTRLFKAENGKNRSEIGRNP